MKRFRRAQPNYAAPNQFHNLWRHFPHHAQICSCYSLYFIVVLSPFPAPRPREGFSLRMKYAIKVMADHFSIKLFAVVHFIILTGLEHRAISTLSSTVKVEWNVYFRVWSPFLRQSILFSSGAEEKVQLEWKKVSIFFLPSKAGQEKMAFHHSGWIPHSGECMPSKKGQLRRVRRRKHFSNNCD